MVPRVKLAYDKKVYDIIHPERRNLTAIRGYKRLGGLPDDPHTDPQDRSWYGPHDRLFVEAETVEMDFHTGPEYGMSSIFKSITRRDPKREGVMHDKYWGDWLLTSLVWCWGWDGAGDLDGPDVEPIWYVYTIRSDCTCISMGRTRTLTSAGKRCPSQTTRLTRSRSSTTAASPSCSASAKTLEGSTHSWRDEAHASLVVSCARDVGGLLVAI